MLAKQGCRGTKGNNGERKIKNGWQGKYGEGRMVGKEKTARKKGIFFLRTTRKETGIVIDERDSNSN